MFSLNYGNFFHFDVFKNHITHTDIYSLSPPTFPLLLRKQSKNEVTTVPGPVLKASTLNVIPNCVHV